MKCPCISCEKKGCGVYHDICPEHKEWQKKRQSAATRRSFEADVTDATVKARLRVRGAEKMNTITPSKNPAKTWLMRYGALKLKCSALERAIRSAMENATNTTVALKEICVQTSGGGEMMANAVVSAIDATKLLDDERQEATQIMAEIMEAIKSVPDEVQQTILIEKYINGRTLQQIQGDIHYEKRNTIILHGRALWEVWQYMKRKGLCE